MGPFAYVANRAWWTEVSLARARQKPMQGTFQDQIEKRGFTLDSDG